MSDYLSPSDAKLVRAIQDEMSDHHSLKFHHEWKGWPGTWTFATAAVRAIKKLQPPVPEACRSSLGDALHSIPAGLMTCDANGSPCDEYVSRWRVLEVAKAYLEQQKSLPQAGQGHISDAGKIVGQGGQGEVVAWEATTCCYIKYVTDARYQKFSPAVQRWYKPYKCSSCAAQPAPVPTIPMPATEDEAAAMAMLGHAWLEQHAPHRLKPAPVPAPVWEVTDELVLKVTEHYYGPLLTGRAYQEQIRKFIKAHREVLALGQQTAPAVPAGWRFDRDGDAIVISHPAVGLAKATNPAPSGQGLMLYMLADDILGDRQSLSAATKPAGKESQ